jgi:transposase
MLPKNFPPWQTVYWWFRRFMRRLLFRTIHDVALMLDREREGARAEPVRSRGRQPVRQGTLGSVRWRL